MPPSGSSTFGRWLSTEVAPSLVALGWQAEARRFVLHTSPPNTGLIEFTRSDTSTLTLYRFRVEVGVFSPRLAQLDPTGLPGTATLRGAGAVAVRLGELVTGEDVVWSLRSDAMGLELSALGDSVRAAIYDNGLPFIEAHLTDERIRESLRARLPTIRGTRLRQLRLLEHDLGQGG